MNLVMASARDSVFQIGRTLKASMKTIRPVVHVVRKARRHRQLRVRQRMFTSYLVDHRLRKLQIGTSDHVLPGWLNVDIMPLYKDVYFMDATKPFPFAEGMFDYVFSEHMIEHVSHGEAHFMLRECYRTLKPGGRIRVATPDLEVLAGLYAREKTCQQRRYIEAVIRGYLPHATAHHEGLVVNQLFDFGHQFIYDSATLTDALQAAGFRRIRRQEPGMSDDPVLCGIDAHAHDYIRFETIVLEAER